MPLWGTAHAAATNKPKFLPADENSKYNKADCYATQAGWVMEAGHVSSGNGNTSATPEVLVAIGDLAGSTDTTGLRAPSITSARFVTTTLAAGTPTCTVEVTWDEGVTIAGSPQLTLANGNEGSGSGRTCVLTYTATGSSANRKRFTASNITVASSDVLTLGGGSQANIVLASSSTISDTVRGGTNLAASVVLTGLTAQTQTVA